MEATEDNVREQVPQAGPPALFNRRYELLLLGLILCMGAWLRLDGLGRVPDGFWYDEALNAADAVAVWEGAGFKLIYPDVFPREPMFLTLLALTVRVLGESLAAMRLLPISLGILTILVLWAALRREWGPGVALASAAVLATMRWHVILSHMILRTNLMPLWICGLVWAALAFARRPGRWRALALGLMLGGGFYTYLAWYLMAPLVAGLMLWLLLRARRERSMRGPLALAVGVGVLVFAPIGSVYLSAPEALASRPMAVTPFAEGLGPGLAELAENTLQTLLMFNWRGDYDPKLNIPNAPALDVVQGAFFLVGLALCVIRARRREPLAWAVLGWLVCGMLATIVTQSDSPNFNRTLVAAPAAAALCGLGIVGCARALAQVKLPGMRPLAAVAVVLALGLSLGLTHYRVQVSWARNIESWISLIGPETQLALETPTDDDALVWIPIGPASHRSFRFLVRHDIDKIRPYEQVAQLPRLLASHADRPQRVAVMRADLDARGQIPGLPPLEPVHAYLSPEAIPWAYLYELPAVPALH